MRKRLSLIMACLLSVSMILPGMGDVAAAKAKNPKLTKKVSVTVKKTKKIKIKNTKKIKKTKWSVKSKKIVKLSKKKKTSVVIKGVKKGKTTVTAKVTLKGKKKPKKLKVTVTVKKKEDTIPSAKPSGKPSAKPTEAVTTAPSDRPSEKPSTSPSASPSPTPEPTPEPTPAPIVPEGTRYEIKAVAANQWKAIGEDRYSGLVFDEAEGTAFYKKPVDGGQGTGAVGFLFNEQEKSIDVSDFDTLEVKLECLSGEGLADNKYSNVRVRLFMGGATGYTDGINVSTGYASSRLRTCELALSTLVKAGISLSNLKAAAVLPNSTVDLGTNGIKVYSFAFVKKEGEEYVSKDIPQAVKATSQYGATSFKLKATKTAPLNVAVTNKNTEVINHKVNWSSSDDTIATVSEDGTVTGIKAGKVSITATVDGYSDLTSSVSVEVYDDSPASVDILVGDKNYMYTTFAEVEQGLSLKAVYRNANNEIVGDAANQEFEIVSKNINDDAQVSITNGVLKATGVTTWGNIRLRAANTGDLKATIEAITVYSDGFHVLITAENMYCACQDKKAGDIVIEGNAAVVKNLTTENSGIGFRCTLPSGKTIGDYDGVILNTYTEENSGLGSFMGSLYMPKNGWDTDVAWPDRDAEEANAKDACANTSSIRFAGGSGSFRFNEVTAEEKTSNKANFALKFGTTSSGNIAVNEIFFYKN